MFNVKKVNRTGVVFPNNEYLENYREYSYGDMISTIGVECMLGNGVFTLGDSGISIEVNATGETGDMGIKMFIEYAKSMSEIIEAALPLMNFPYKDFYQHYITDLMPAEGKLI